MADKVKKEINSFTDLPKGWHFGEGVGANETAVKATHDVHNLMIENGAEEIEVFPAIDGGVLISGYFDNESLDVSCRPNEGMEIVHEIDDNLKYEKEGLCLNDVKKYLEELNWSKRSYGYYIQNISASEKNDLPVKLFNPPAINPGSRSSILNVLVHVVEMNASISVNITDKSLVFHACFGESSRKSYRTTAKFLKNHQTLGMTVTGI